MKKLFTLISVLGMLSVAHAQTATATKDAQPVSPAVNVVDALQGNVQCPVPGGSCCHGMAKTVAVTDGEQTRAETGTKTKPASSCQEVTIGFTTVNPNKEKKETPESED